MQEFNCNNRCDGNCCDVMFLPVPDSEIEHYRQFRYIFVENKGPLDLDWVAMHPSVEVVKGVHFSKIIISPLIGSLLVNPYNGKSYIKLPQPCRNLMPNGRCKIFRNRPQQCKVAPCAKESTEPWFHWLWEEAHR